MKILEIVGSNRKVGNTESLVQEVIKYAGYKTEINLISLRDYSYRSCMVVRLHINV